MNRIIVTLLLVVFAYAGATAFPAQAADQYGACQDTLNVVIPTGGAVEEVSMVDYSSFSDTLTLHGDNGETVWQGAGLSLGDRDGLWEKLEASFIAEVVDAVQQGHFYYFVEENSPGNWKAYYAFVTLKDLCATSFFPVSLKLGDLPRGIQERLPSQK